jgi:hypothetical protein
VNTSDWVGYADDLELFFPNKDTLQQALVLLNKKLQRYHLKINITKTMIFNYKYLNKDPYPTTIVSLNDVPIENKVVFRYLGNDIKYDELSTGDAEITLRINLAEDKFQELKPKLRNFNISLSIRMVFLNTFVRSRLTYSAQT